MTDTNIYEQCPVCHSHRIERDACRTCDGEGYVATGVVVGQFDRAIEDAKRLQYIESLKLILSAPQPFNGRRGDWACYEHPKTVYRGSTAREAIDAAIKGIVGS